MDEDRPEMSLKEDRPPKLKLYVDTVGKLDTRWITVGGRLESVWLVEVQIIRFLVAQKLVSQETTHNNISTLRNSQVSGTTVQECLPECMLWISLRFPTPLR